MSNIKIDPANVDNVVADEEADAYLKAFGERVGRDLGFL